MIVLALDTATPCPAVALAGPGTDAVRPVPPGRAASEHVLAEIDAILRDAEISLGAVGRIAALSGPGSFTGIRVGLATAWGLSRALGIELETMGSLEAAAESARAEGAVVVRPTLPAERGEIYVSRYDVGGERARELESPAVAAEAAAGDGLFPIRAASPPRILPALACARAVARRPGAACASPQALYVRLSPAEEPRGVGLA